MKSYDYTHRDGILELNWDQVAALAQHLAVALAAAGADTVVGIARAGLLPAVIVAAALRCDLWPVRVTRREQDSVTYATPQWKVDVAPEVAGHTVAVIDEMADTGETLALVAKRVQARGAARVITASLCAHTWADPRPAHVALTTDALVIFPWDRRVLVNGRWAPHPELEEALRAQQQRKQESKP
jgi:hypoxanthine phosphoribosyltransferase